MTRAQDWARRNWVLLGALCMFVGSDYKFRTRSTTASISGSPDKFVLLELGLYAALAGYVLLKRAAPPRAVRLPAPLLLAVLYGVVMVVSVANTPYPWFGLVRTVEMSIGIGFAVVIGLQATREDLHRLTHGFMVLVTISVLYGIAVPSVPLSNQQVGRFTWLAIHPTIAGVYVGVGTLIAFVYLTRNGPRPGPRWRRPVYAALLVVQGYGLLATQTRGAVLGAAAALFVANWSALRGASRRVEYLLGAAALGALALLFGSHAIAAYFARGESTEQLTTLNSRTDLWSYALEAIQHKPVYGWGIGASQGIFLDEIGLGGGHNMFIQVTVDLGVLGLLVWAALVGVTVVRVAALPRDDAEGVLVDRALLAGILTMILVDGFFIAGPGGICNVSSTWLLLAAGWVTCLGRLLRQPRVARWQPRSVLAG